MKTTTYIAFVITNKTTHNFLLGTTQVNDEKLINSIRVEHATTNDNPTLKNYIIDHPETYQHSSSFAETLKYFGSDCFEAKMLGMFLEESEAKHRIQLALDSYLNNLHRKVYYNECFNLKEHIESEEEEQQKIIHLKENLKKENEAENDENKKASSKKQNITIVEIESGVEHQFETKGECMKWLNCASDTFSRFLKGNTKLNKKYMVKK